MVSASAEFIRQQSVITNCLSDQPRHGENDPTYSIISDCGLKEWREREKARKADYRRQKQPIDLLANGYSAYRG